MPETPDFDQIARALRIELVGDFAPLTDEEREEKAADLRIIAVQLRQVWNARGAADVEQIEKRSECGRCKVSEVTDAIAALDR